MVAGNFPRFYMVVWSHILFNHILQVWQCVTNKQPPLPISSRGPEQMWVKRAHMSCQALWQRLPLDLFKCLPDHFCPCHSLRPTSHSSSLSDLDGPFHVLSPCSYCPVIYTALLLFLLPSSLLQFAALILTLLLLPSQISLRTDGSSPCLLKAQGACC